MKGVGRFREERRIWYEKLSKLKIQYKRHEFSNRVLEDKDGNHNLDTICSIKVEEMGGGMKKQATYNENETI